MKALINHSQIPLLESLTSLLNGMAAGKMPKEISKHIASAPLTAIAKKNNGIRPIAVGQTLRRIVSKLAFKEALPPISSYLSPYQVGVGKKRAIEHSVFDFQDFINKSGKSTSKMVLLLDFENAFNIFDRQVFMNQVRKYCPSISHWVEYCYMDESNLYAGDRIINSSVGTQQGDPLAGLLFCLALHILVIKISEQFPDFDFMKWYMDDGILGGDIPYIYDIYCLIQQEAPQLGLKLQISKTCLFSAASDEALSIFPVSMVRIRNTGFPALGAPIGDDFFIGSYASKIVEKLL